MTTPSAPRYKTDFNDLTPEGLLTTLPGWGGSVLLPEEGTPVELFDGDENSCIGIVERVDRSSGLIYVKPLWDEWSDGAQSTLPDLHEALFESLVLGLKQKTSSAVGLK